MKELRGSGEVCICSRIEVDNLCAIERKMKQLLLRCRDKHEAMLYWQRILISANRQTREGFFATSSDL